MNICDKNISSDNVEWSSKNAWKIIYPDVKANLKLNVKEIKELVAVLWFFWELNSKFEIQHKKGIYFSLNFGGYTIQPDIVY